MTSSARPASAVRRHQLITYVGLTFAISWVIWLGLIVGSLDIQTLPGAVLNVVAIAGPSIAALVLATILGGGELQRLLAGFSISRLSVRWLVVALLLPLAIMVAAIAVSVLGTGQSEILRAGASHAFAIGGFLGWTIGVSALFTWLFNQTGGSLIVVILFHAAVNLAVFLPTAVGSRGAASLLNVLITWLVAIGVVVRFGRAWLASPPRVDVVAAR